MAKGLMKTKVEKVKKAEVTLMQTKSKKAQIKRNQFVSESNLVRIPLNPPPILISILVTA
jgi:hypothetical protein